VTGLAMVASLVLAVQALDDGRLAPVLVAVVTLTPLAAAEAVTTLPVAAVGLVRARTAAERVLGLLDAEPAPGHEQPADGGAADDMPAGPVEPLPRPVLTAAGLACGWPGAQPTLTGVELELSPGRRIAVVGPSGGGKTTLLLTLAGLIPPVSGRLTLRTGAYPGPRPSDDHATRPDPAPARGAGDAACPGDVDVRVLRRTVSFTAEDAHVFTTTVRENLRVARPDATDAELVAALHRAGLHGWPHELPDGLDTRLGSGGTGLSGGERRRLLLARALLTGAGVLLLDEPAEHLDPATADTLLRDVLAPAGTADGPGAADPRAVLVVTHRLGPLDAADEVLVVDGGSVVARGTHAWLLERSLTYRDAVQAEQGLPRTGAAVRTGG